MAKFLFYLNRIIAALNFAAKKRQQREMELNVLREMVSEVCSTIRSQNALAEAQIKLMQGWFATITTDPTPGRSIHFDESNELEQFANEHGVSPSDLKQYF